MVSETMDMLDESDARPDDTSTVEKHSEPYRKVRVVEELAENGEAILQLTNGDTVEVHGHDVSASDLSYRHSCMLVMTQYKCTIPTALKFGL